MLRTYRYPLRPTETQAIILSQWFGMCCDHKCTCGAVLGRDLNAAMNILALGGSAVEAGLPAVEAEGLI